MTKSFLLKNLLPLSFLTAALVFFSYSQLDVPIAEYFANIGPSLALTAQCLINLIDPKYHYFLWPFLFIITLFLPRKKHLSHRFLLLAIAIPFANLVVHISKFIFSRARPALLLEDNVYGFFFLQGDKASYLSFPSGHSCTIGAICGALCCFYPRHSPFFLVIGFALACSRVVLDVHFLSDVIAGFAIGILVSQYVYIQMKKKEYKV